MGADTLSSLYFPTLKLKNTFFVGICPKRLVVKRSRGLENVNHLGDVTNKKGFGERITLIICSSIRNNIARRGRLSSCEKNGTVRES